MELYIDETRVEIDDASAAAITLSIAAVTDPEQARAGYTRTLKIPMSVQADNVFGHAADIHSTDHFNARTHIGRIEHEGVRLIEGPLYLTGAITLPGGRGHYEVHIIGGSKEWAVDAAARPLRQTTVGYSKPLSAATVAESWTDKTHNVRFFPVARTNAEKDYSAGSVFPARKLLSMDDYHPFVACKTVLTGVLHDLGWSLESEFLNSDWFRSLYMSGNYPVRDAGAIKDRMDFLARRAADFSAPAGYDGRVYADPYRSTLSVRNLVDVPTTEQSSGGGSITGDTFTRGGCFKMDDKRIAFIPTEAVEVGFIYSLRYRTPARIKNRIAMEGFDEIYLGEETSHKFTLANPWSDRRNEARSGIRYTTCVFDHVEGTRYKIDCMYCDTAGNEQFPSNQVLEPKRMDSFEFVTLSSPVRLKSIVLSYRTNDTDPWEEYKGDWALYDGFAVEDTYMDIDLTIRTPHETVSPGSPKFFDTIWFAGAKPGTVITVKSGTSIRPVFYGQPSENDTVAFADLFAHDATQMDFLMALRQMFNLIFRTDKGRKKIYIEPARTFYIADDPLMWTSRIDRSRPIRVEELGGEVAKQTTWSYRTGDGAVSHFNREAGGHFGQFTAEIENAAAGKTSRVIENPMFTPSLTATDVVIGAPSAQIVMAGDGSYEPGTDNLNFLPKIVRFEGMKPLPEGEVWGWPATGTLYPKIAFHAPEAGYTLCFENRDGQTGLHENWDGDVRLWNESRRVTLNLHLSAVEIENLDFRRLVHLTIDGESALYRMEEVADYNPKNTSTKCSLIKHIF